MPIVEGEAILIAAEVPRASCISESYVYSDSSLDDRIIASYGRRIGNFRVAGALVYW
jgi:hypothetical protein